MPNPTELVVSPGYIDGPPPHSYARRELTFQDLWGVLSRRRAVVFGTLITMVVLAALIVLFSTRLYKATAQVQVQKDNVDALSLNNMIVPGGGGVDAVEANLNIQTQAQILQSESLALEVIKELNLENSPDFHSAPNPIGWVMDLFSPAGVADPKGVPLEEAPKRRAHVLKIFASRLKVLPVSGTRLITVTYYSKDPQTAAQVVNRLIQDLTDYNFKTRHNATQQAASWLEGQLGDLRKQTEDLQNKVVALQKDSGIFSTGVTDPQGHQQTYAPTLDRLQQETAQLSAAQSARIMKGALYQVVKDGDPELISGIAGNGILAGASPSVANSLNLLQNLRAQEATAKATYDEAAAKYGPGYPKLAELRANLDSIQSEIKAEAQRIAGRVKNDYEVAQDVENNDRAVFNNERQRAEDLNNKTAEYELAREEANQSRNLYQDLRVRMNEADLVAGLRSGNIATVDPARPTPRPDKPNVLIFAAGSIFGGLFLGVCLAMFREATDRRIQGPEDLQAICGSAPIGFLPYHDVKNAKKGTRALPDSSKPSLIFGKTSPGKADLESITATNTLVASTQPYSPYTEALRALRTSLMMSNHGGQSPQVILVASSVPGEGKSMLSVNLAIVYAQRGKRVLLVDGDLRTPVLHERLGLGPNEGLTSLLSTEPMQGTPIGRPIPLKGAPNVFVLPAGKAPHYPAELLASDAMADLVRQWRKDYDYVVIDGAPILPVTDSVILSRYADFTLLVGRHNVTDRRAIERSMHLLRAQGTNSIGVVLNAVKTSTDAHYQYYGYKQMGSYYRSESHA